MSLYKQPETTVYFKKIAEREEASHGNDASAPKIKESRVARILSLKNDLLCIKDVARFHDMAQLKKASKNRSIYAQNGATGNQTMSALRGEDATSFNALMKGNIKQLYQSPKPYFSGMSSPHHQPGYSINLNGSNTLHGGHHNIHKSLSGTASKSQLLADPFAKTQEGFGDTRSSSKKLKPMSPSQ